MASQSVPNLSHRDKLISQSEFSRSDIIMSQSEISQSEKVKTRSVSQNELSSQSEDNDIFSPNIYRPIPKILMKEIMPLIKQMLKYGCYFNQEWISLPKIPTSFSEYWENCLVTLPNSEEEKGLILAERFKKGCLETVPKANLEKYLIIKLENGWHISEKANPDIFWKVEAKLVLNLEDISSIAHLLIAYIPPGKTVSMQADSHLSGDCWVGLICSYDHKKIPFTLISADIGCGMCLLPLLKGGKQLVREISEEISEKTSKFSDENSSTLSLSPAAFKLIQLQIGYRTRTVLARGQQSEKGLIFSNLILEVLSYLNDSEFIQWLDDFAKVFSALNIPVPKSKQDISLPFQLTPHQFDIFCYVTGFSLSLGSSGNHFLEMNQASDNRLYLVIHSGSRGLGALIYDRFSKICLMLFGTGAMAMGKYADLYNLAFSVLSKFATLNRLLCGIAVLKELGLDYDGEVLKNYLVEKCPLFKGLQNYPQEVTQLIKGVTHNGIKCFYQEEEKKKIYVMCKGSIAISRRASCGIVALRAGDGVAVLAMLNPSAKWIEADMKDLEKLADYEVIHDLSQTDIALMGHGAGRAGPANQTWKNSAYEAMIAYYEKKEIYGSLSPNVLGDNPEIAYKNVNEVRKYLPEQEALSFDLLVTRVNHKEGIDMRKTYRVKFRDFVEENWEKLSEEWKLMCDVRLITQELGKEQTEELLEEQRKIYEKMLEKGG